MKAMHSGTRRSTLTAAALISLLLLSPRARTEEGDKAALATALSKISTTLENGLQASEKAGRPISAKFEIEDGKLQLSIYTVAADGFTEVIVTPETGDVASSEKITDADDLKAATSQKAAMDKASTSLLAAIQRVVQQNAGARAVSIYPELKDNEPVAAVTMLGNGQLRTVSEKTQLSDGPKTCSVEFAANRSAR
jgi:hypothetical protein